MLGIDFDMANCIFVFYDAQIEKTVWFLKWTNVKVTDDPMQIL
jgi:hypothetical protein